VESPSLRKIFLLLREELKESDIPSRTTIRKRVEQAYEKHMEQLEVDLAVFSSLYISFNMLTISNRNLWGKYLSPQTVGQIQTSHLLWQ
jgi:hypothetical protein